ncbi:MAG: TadE/TadG family type IV pilus assembly protein [Pseudomonadota bacterium]
MLKRFKSLLKDTSGNVAIMGGLLIIPLMSVVGATIDYTSYINLRNDVQNSLDAAGLAAGREVADGEDDEGELEIYSETFFEANLDNNIDSESYEFDFDFVPGDTSIEPPIPDQVNICVDIDYDTIFGHLIGVQKLEERICSIVSLGNRTVEVALVLDNSGSMSGNRISTLRTEAKALVDTIFNSAQLTTLPDPVKFSLVPFAGTVNVGTQNQNQAWMDLNGWAPAHHENFDWENTYRTNNPTRVFESGGTNIGFEEQIGGTWEWKTRYDVFDMVGESWGGCVEMRPWPHNTLDTVAFSTDTYNNLNDSVDADGDGIGDGTSALFVPFFAPDEPDHRFAERQAGFTDLTIAPGTDHDPDDDSYRNNYLYDFQDYNPSSPTQRIQLYTDFEPGYVNQARISPEGDDDDPQRGSDDQINRTNWMFKYQRNQQYNGSLSQFHGPNDGCTVRPMNELSTDQQTVKDNIDLMIASGTTNIQQGLTWGWRTLSPSEPFTGGREYDDRKNLKFVILLTDGNNFYSADGDSTPNNTAYGAWGYARPDNVDPQNIFNGLPTHNRWLEGLDELDGTIYENTTFDITPESSNDFEAIMNAHTLQACNNVRAAGISVYAIAFDVPSTGGVRELLEECAGSGIRDGQEIIANTQFYHDVDGNELKDALANIAKQIANLRIAG